MRGDGAVHGYDKSTLLRESLNVGDKATSLPQHYVSSESCEHKNVVLTFEGSASTPNPKLIPIELFTGVSVVPIPQQHAENVLNDLAQRREVKDRLRESIPSEVTSVDVQIGPQLDGDEHDRDTETWVAGFDGTSCSLGVYSATERQAPRSESGMHLGMQSAQTTYYLVCKAGGGLATQEFHSRLTKALTDGTPLDECLAEAGNPGARALNRARNAGSRNRRVLLYELAKALTYASIDTISDNAGCVTAKHRLVIPKVDVIVNDLRRCGDSAWQCASGCVDAHSSTGMIVASNVAEGFVVWTGATDTTQVQVRNAHCSCVPFTTARLMTDREAVARAARAYAVTRNGSFAHPDHAWLRHRFCWKNACDSTLEALRGIPTDEARFVDDLEPPALWGTFAPESFAAQYTTNLGLSQYHMVRLHPELVLLSGNERASVRAANQFVSSAHDASACLS